MTSKERLLAALNRQVPDRLPATIHDWMTYWLNHYMNGMGAMETYEHFGLDAVIYFKKYVEKPVIDLKYFNIDLIPGPNWDVSYKVISSTDDEVEYAFEIRTPEGSLTKRVRLNQYTGWITEFPIKELEQIELIRKYMPVPHPDVTSINRLYDEIGDRGLLRSSVYGHQGGPWQDACCFAGTVQMIYHAMDNPDWVHEFLRILTDRKLKYIDRLKGAKYDVMENGGGDGSSTVISPDMFKEFCLPYDKQIHAALKEIGIHPTYHTCGGMMPILDLIVENGCDASETLSPKEIGGDVDLKEVKRRIGDKVALIGGMNQTHVLEQGTPETVRQAVFRCFEQAGAGGGYIMMPCDHFFFAPVENIKAYADAARECTY